jgi:starvation-inducible DNA-binding protein
VIGLDQEYTSRLNDRLNILLSNYQIFYMNVRGFHWNIRGEKFFELHAKFEELYDDLQLKIDELAERVLTLGGEPLHTFSDYLSRSEVEVAKSMSNGKAAVAALVHSFSILIRLQRELLALSAEADDEGTNSLMSDYIREQEKLVWMYRSFLG